MKAKPPLERFMRWIDKRPDGCWLWTGRRSFRGSYGQFGVSSNITRYAHRFSYEAHVGPVPAGMQLDHLCRVRLCCNPAHLEPVSARENILRGTGPSAVNAARACCTHGHQFTPENTYYKKGKRGCIACRRIFDNQPERREKRKLYKRELRRQARAA